MNTGWAEMTTTETALAERWYTERVAPSEIAKRLGRRKSTTTRHVVKKCPDWRRGGPRQSDSGAECRVGRHCEDAAPRNAHAGLHAKRNILLHTLREKPLF